MRMPARQLPASVDFYRRAFAMDVADRFDFDGFTLVYQSGEGNGFELELTINHGRGEPYALGDAYGHIAFVVDDLGALMAKFFFVQDPDGYRIEVLHHHGRYR